jgi:hypothetical protein
LSVDADRPRRRDLPLCRYCGWLETIVAHHCLLIAYAYCLGGACMG